MADKPDHHRRRGERLPTVRDRLKHWAIVLTSVVTIFGALSFLATATFTVTRFWDDLVFAVEFVNPESVAKWRSERAAKEKVLDDRLMDMERRLKGLERR